jgi:mRNA interferase HicA
MKRIDLERHLREQGCVLYREGGVHSIWLNPSLRKIASVPRQREIKDGYSSRDLQAVGNSAP